ncbi:hypothetical protein [Streptomyces sp. NPDC002746]
MPYLWQVVYDPKAAAPPLPAGPHAGTWGQLEASLTDVLRSFCSPHPLLTPIDDWELGHTWGQLEPSLTDVLRSFCSPHPLLTPIDDWELGFNIVNRADHDQHLAVLCAPSDGLALFQQDHKHTRDEAHDEAMSERGWDEKLPVHNWWMASFEPTLENASKAARLASIEMQLRGASSPADLALTQVSAGQMGQLLLPGLPIGAAA